MKTHKQVHNTSKRYKRKYISLGFLSQRIQTHRQTFHTTLANASTIPPSLRLWFGSQLSRYKSQTRGVTMATPSKIPLPHMEGRKGCFAPLTLLSLLPSLHCKWSGTPDADRDTFSDVPKDNRGLLWPTIPQNLPSFLLLYQGAFLLASNDTTLIKSSNWFLRLQARLSLAPLSAWNRGVFSYWTFRASKEGS